MMDRPPAVKAESTETKTNEPATETAARERVFCLDAATGKMIWQHSYPCAYNIGYPAGPRTTPVAADGRVYTLGAVGELLCLEADSGKVVWRRNFALDFGLSKAPV